MILRLLITAVISFMGFSGVPVEHFSSEAMTPRGEVDQTSSVPDNVYFDETGQYLSGELLEFWVEYGGIPVFGYPVSGELEQNGLTVQYFERAVLEIHPDNDPDWRVLLRRLGDEASSPSNMRNGAFAPSQDTGSLRYFSETDQVLSSRFYAHWESHGGVRIFGFPISSEFGADGKRYQYFERAVFEYHADNPAEWRILQPHLGSEAAKTDGIDTSPQPHDEDVPAYHRNLFARGGVSGDAPVVYFTFDDGPHPKWTPQMLDVLDDYDARATFFAVGKYMDAHPELVERIREEGHVVANHTYEHPSLVGMSWDEFKWQIRKTERAAGGDIARCLRPPYGAMDANTKLWAESLGYEISLWDVDTNDWQRPGAEVIARRIVRNVSDGEVVLLHDGGNDRAQSVEGLRIAMEQLDAKGYRFKAMC